MKEKLKGLDLKLTELAGYLNISRPTLYKFLEMYISDNQYSLRRDVKELFDFISKKDTISKKQVLKYILDQDKNLHEREGPILKDIGNYKDSDVMKLVQMERVSGLIIIQLVI